jgi:mono/diheme cytochrome c family protein
MTHRRDAMAVLTLLAALAAPTLAQDAATVARGKEVYQELRCQTCHAIAGAGNRRYPLDGVGAKLSEEQLRKWIVSPREMNPAVRKRSYDNVPADKLDALVAYLRSLKPGAALR